MTQLGEIKLLRKEIISNGIGTRKDHIVDYIFLNNSPDEQWKKQVKSIVIKQEGAK